MPSIPEHLAVVIGDVVSSEERLRRRAAALADRVMEEAERQLVEGSPRVKESMVRALLPAITKAIAVEDEGDSSTEELRREVAELMAAVRGTVGQSTARALGAGAGDGPPEDGPGG